MKRFGGMVYAPFNGRNSGTAARLIALGVFVLGLLNLWSALLARGPGRAVWLHETAHLPLVLGHVGRTLIALFGLGLLLLAGSLARHKKQAWRMALFLTVLAPLGHMVKGLDWEEALICAGMAGVLLAFRPAFYAGNDRPSARQGVLAALCLLGIAALYGPVGFYFLRSEFKPEWTPRRGVLQTTHRLFYVPSLRPLRAQTNRARWFDDSLLTVGLSAMGYAVFMLLRPVLPREKSGGDRDMVRRLLAVFPSDPLSYFALLSDKRYLIGGKNGTEDGAEKEAQWGIAYVVVGRNAVALGDPIGDPEQAQAAIDTFCQMCRTRDWSPAFYQTTARNFSAYQKQKLRVLQIGEDALLPLSTWNMKGKAFQDMRTAINKMAKLGMVFEAFSPNAPDAADTLTQMNAISNAWLLAHKGEEKTFGMGRFAPNTPLFADSRFFVARKTETGRVWGFVSFVPIGGRGWSLDLMRRETDAPNGLMEFLIASSVLLFQSEGAEVVSMGLSPLSGGDVPEAGEAEIMVRGRALLYERFNYFYGFKGLHAFKEKFGPSWEGRYLVYPGETALAQTVYAVIRAHSPRGLWTYAAHLRPLTPLLKPLRSGQISRTNARPSKPAA